MNYVPAIGDLLIRPKALGFLDHPGVAVGHDAVLHNTPDKGEHVATFQQFAAGQPVAVQRTGADPISFIGRVRNILSRPKGYHPVSRNCEHTVTEALTGTPRSAQLRFFLFFVATILFIVWLVRRR